VFFAGGNVVVVVVMLNILKTRFSITAKTRFSGAAIG